MTGNPLPQPPKRRAWKLCAAAALAFVVTIGLWKGAQALLRGTEAPILADVPFSSAVYSSEGALLRMEPASDGIYRLRTPLSDIPNALIRATLHYEDRRFWSHPGVDPAAVVRALWSTAFGGRRMGASTITMQVARLKLHLDTDTIPGKLRQMAEALRLELHHTKAEILEAYFNLAPYGGNVEGAGAAAEAYFGRKAGDLHPGEAASLAVVPQNPVRRRPWRGPDFDEARRRAASALLRDGIAPESWRRLLLAPIEPRSPAELPYLAPHYSRLVIARRPGERIRGTLSLRLQERLESILRDAVKRLEPWGIRNGAAAIMDTRTRSLVALVGSVDFFDDAIEGEVNAYTAKRSPGSTLKPFIYGLALDQGLIHSKSILIDRPSRFSGYAPQNADGSFRGPLPADAALVLSRNIPAIELERRLDPDLYTLLQKAGAALPHGREHYGLSITLGSAEVSMEKLLELYGALRREGLLASVRVAEDEAPSPSTAILSPQAAWVVRKMLETRGEFVRSAHGRIPLIYKTGTSNGYRDAWAVGFFGPYVAAVWLGNFNNRPNPYLQGAMTAAPIFRTLAQMTVSETGLHPEDEAPPSGVREEAVCRSTGDLDPARCTLTAKAWFIPGKSPIRPTGILRDVWIDRETGLRACRFEPGKTENRTWEFWPTHFQRAFFEAGIVKRPPPPWMPGCAQAASREGAAPLWTSPEPGSRYFTGTAGPNAAAVALEAGAEADVRVLYWYEGSRFIGASPAGSAFPARFPAGRHRVSVVDDAGRSAQTHFEVLKP